MLTSIKIHWKYKATEVAVMMNTRFQDFCHGLVGWESLKHGRVCLSFNNTAQQIPFTAATVAINVLKPVTLETLLEANPIHQ